MPRSSAGVPRRQPTVSHGATAGSPRWSLAPRLRSPCCRSCHRAELLRRGLIGRRTPAVSGEIPLSGGFVNDVARMRDTVHRPVAARGAFVHQLLGYLEERGWRGAPRFLGIDAQGREILTYLDGHVAWHET